MALNGWPAETMRNMPSGTRVERKEREAEMRVGSPRRTFDVFRHLVARHLDFPVQQAVWHSGVGERRLAERPPWRPTVTVRTVEDVSAGGIGVNARVSPDPLDLFHEDWILRRYGRAWCASRYASSNLSASASLTISGRALPRPTDLGAALRPPRNALITPASATRAATTAAAIHSRVTSRAGRPLAISR